ncbi:Hypothetical_protein [Hexamita inflata]|uniref:Hypothetical_protein n=1 Tax=Hexamita inflata TaxID=28002 RepID=A0ABP1KPW0_9EUKA
MNFEKFQQKSITLFKKSLEAANITKQFLLEKFADVVDELVSTMDPPETPIYFSLHQCTLQQPIPQFILDATTLIADQPFEPLQDQILLARLNSNNLQFQENDLSVQNVQFLLLHFLRFLRPFLISVELSEKLRYSLNNFSATKQVLKAMDQIYKRNLIFMSKFISANQGKEEYCKAMFEKYQEGDLEIVKFIGDYAEQFSME